MSNWKDDQERKLQARQEAAAQEARRTAELAEKERKKKEEAEARQQAQLLAEHQRRFRCSYGGCTNVSEGPTIKEESMGGPGAPDWRDHVYSEYKDWDEPQGLVKCSICGKWYCELHIRQGVCKKDHEKGYLPGDKPRRGLW